MVSARHTAFHSVAPCGPRRRPLATVNRPVLPWCPVAVSVVEKRRDACGRRAGCLRRAASASSDNFTAFARGEGASGNWNQQAGKPEAPTIAGATVRRRSPGEPTALRCGCPSRPVGASRHRSATPLVANPAPRPTSPEPGFAETFTSLLPRCYQCGRAAADPRPTPSNSAPLAT